MKKERKKIYLAYVTTTSKNELTNELVHETNMIKAFPNKETAIMWARRLYQQTKERAYTFYWSESENNDGYSARLTEYWNSDLTKFVNKSETHTTQTQVNVERVDVNDEIDDAYNEVGEAIYC